MSTEPQLHEGVEKVERQPKTAMSHGEWADTYAAMLTLSLNTAAEGVKKAGCGYYKAELVLVDRKFKPGQGKPGSVAEVGYEVWRTQDGVKNCLNRVTRHFQHIADYNKAKDQARMETLQKLLGDIVTFALVMDYRLQNVPPTAPQPTTDEENSSK